MAANVLLIRNRMLSISSLEADNGIVTTIAVAGAQGGEAKLNKLP
jgi:hypothetical protein